MCPLPNMDWSVSTVHERKYLYSNIDNLVLGASSEKHATSLSNVMGTGIMEGWKAGSGGMRSNFIYGTDQKLKLENHPL